MYVERFMSFLPVIRDRFKPGSKHWQLIQLELKYICNVHINEQQGSKERLTRRWKMTNYLYCVIRLILIIISINSRHWAKCTVIEQVMTTLAFHSQALHGTSDTYHRYEGTTTSTTSVSAKLLLLCWHGDADARCDSCVLVLHWRLLLARCVASTIPQPWRLQSSATLSSQPFLGHPLALLLSTLPYKAILGRRQLSILTTWSWILPTISSLIPKCALMCSFLMWSCLETPMIRRRQPFSKTLNCLFISAVNMQVSE